jgi:hypothetical protein
MMLFLLILACVEQSPIALDVCEEEVSVTEVAVGLTEKQKEVSYIIEEEFSQMGIPPNVIAAAIVNAIAESGLNPQAVGDKGKAVGTFQLHKNGLGNKLSVDDRKNVYTSSNIIGVQILKNNRLSILDEKNEKISVLTQVITEDIMRPDNIKVQKDKRSKLSKKIFPERL